MYCPHKIIFNRRWLIVACHTDADYYAEVPLRELLNPFRYSFCIRPGTSEYRILNDNGR
ncbi:unnamed protein product, partial [Laminaria digitata]